MKKIVFGIAVALALIGADAFAQSFSTMQDREFMFRRIGDGGGAPQPMPAPMATFIKPFETEPYVRFAIMYGFTNFSDRVSGVDLGFVDDDSHSGSSAGFSIAYGTPFYGQWSIEYEVGLMGDLDSNMDNHKLELGAWTAGVNFLYNFDVANDRVLPYIGAGLGIAELSVRHSGEGECEYAPGEICGYPNPVSKSSMNFMWRIVAGIGTPVSERFDMDFRYSLASLGGVKSTGNYLYFDVDEDDYFIDDLTNDISGVMSHQLSLGLRYRF
ncbi:MAG: outer membrane beta-barrel protein [Alphaproteobacteria bacterium]|nr:outer membrane beta-barrel protein [Alphaproteobacteria bacterium]